MSLILDIDGQSQQTLEEAFGKSLGRAALEALVAEGYRAGKFTRLQVQKLLGLADRWTTESWLKQHHISQDLTLEDVLQDAQISRQARNVQ